MSNHVSQAFADKLEQHDFTVAEWVALRELHDGDSPPSRVAEKLGMTRGAITKLADRLISRSLATRIADPADGRAQTLRLTAKGRRFVPTLAALADENDAEFFAHLTRTDRETLRRLLQGIVDRRGLTATPID